MHPYIHTLAKQLEANANSVNASSAKAYMLNQFDFYGLKSPLLKTLTRVHFKTTPVHTLKELELIVKECFGLPQREFQYAAIGLFAYHKKLWKSSSVKLIEYCLVHKSWWDSVDNIASDWLDPYFRLFPEQVIPVTATWNQSSNIWLQRSSIMFQKKLKGATDTGLLSRYILSCKDSKEFFIRKAIGWALREYAKSNPEWVRQFVQEHTLSPLSSREAMKHLK